MKLTKTSHTSQWASYQIRKIGGCACVGNAGNVFPRHRLQRKPLVSDPGMHHGTCVTHVPWCMSGSLTRGGGESVPDIPGACAIRKFAYLVRGPLRAMYEASFLFFWRKIPRDIERGYSVGYNSYQCPKYKLLAQQKHCTGCHTWGPLHLHRNHVAILSPAALRRP